jgi:hypothetical protein
VRARAIKRMRLSWSSERTDPRYLQAITICRSHRIATTRKAGLKMSIAKFDDDAFRLRPAAKCVSGVALIYFPDGSFKAI